MASFISRLLAIHLVLQLVSPLSYADEENGPPAEKKAEDLPEKAPDPSEFRTFTSARGTFQPITNFVFDESLNLGLTQLVPQSMEKLLKLVFFKIMFSISDSFS